MTQHIGQRAVFNVSSTTDEEAVEDVRGHVWDVMDHLLELEGVEGSCVHSAAVSFDEDLMEVTIELAGYGDTYEQAEAAIDGAMRSAIHAAGGWTPGWRGSTPGRHSIGLFTTRSKTSEFIDA